MQPQDINEESSAAKLLRRKRMAVGLVLLVLTLLSGVGFVAVKGGWQAHRGNAEKDHVDAQIAVAINALLPDKIRNLAMSDPVLTKCGKFQSWRPTRWHRSGPTWMGAAEAPWRLQIQGIAKFETADVPCQIAIQSGKTSGVHLYTLDDQQLKFFGPDLATRLQVQNRMLVVDGNGLIIHIWGVATHPNFVAAPGGTSGPRPLPR